MAKDETPLDHPGFIRWVHSFYHAKMIRAGVVKGKQPVHGYMPDRINRGAASHLVTSVDFEYPSIQELSKKSRLFYSGDDAFVWDFLRFAEAVADSAADMNKNGWLDPEHLVIRLVRVNNPEHGCYITEARLLVLECRDG